MISLPTPETLQRRVQQSLSDEQVAQFQRDGAMCIRQLLSAERDQRDLVHVGCPDSQCADGGVSWRWRSST